ncbi:hypothetical protein FIU97_00060 [Roseivivax sp. THAF40]|nr:hypothetical protein FIU97_00060 [Roseivivax sp. THAF40]
MHHAPGQERKEPRHQQCERLESDHTSLVGFDIVKVGAPNRERHRLDDEERRGVD